MRWPELLAAIFAQIQSSALLTGVFGSSITDAEERDFKVPTLRINVITNIETENYEPSIIQFDVWTRNKSDQIIAETELRRLFHRDTPYTFQDVGVFSIYQSRTRLEGPQDGVLGVALDFRFEPLRSRYTAPIEIFALEETTNFWQIILDGDPDATLVSANGFVEFDPLKPPAEFRLLSRSLDPVRITTLMDNSIINA